LFRIFGSEISPKPAILINQFSGVGKAEEVTKKQIYLNFWYYILVKKPEKGMGRKSGGFNFENRICRTMVDN